MLVTQTTPPYTGGLEGPREEVRQREPVPDLGGGGSGLGCGVTGPISHIDWKVSESSQMWYLQVRGVVPAEGQVRQHPLETKKVPSFGLSASVLAEARHADDGRGRGVRRRRRGV